MNFLRYVILVIATAATVVGIMIMTGWLVPRTFPEHYRVALGAVVCLYGVYRFVIAYFRNPKAKHDASR